MEDEKAMSIETAKAKLRAEAKACGGMEKVIAGWLEEIMDDELAALVDRKEYTLSEMGRFIMALAKKELNGRNGCLPDEVVYGFATDYYHESRKTIEEKIKGIPASAPSAAAGKPPKAAQAAAKTQQDTASAAKAQQKTVHAPEKKKAEKPKSQAQEGQLSLFDLMGGYANA